MSKTYGQKLYDVPKECVSLISNAKLTKGKKYKLIGEYHVTDGSVLAVLDNIGHLFLFDDIKIIRDWEDKVNESEES